MLWNLPYAKAVQVILGIAAISLFKRAGGRIRNPVTSAMCGWVGCMGFSVRQKQVNTANQKAR